MFVLSSFRMLLFISQLSKYANSSLPRGAQTVVMILMDFNVTLMTKIVPEA